MDEYLARGGQITQCPPAGSPALQGRPVGLKPTFRLHPRTFERAD